MIQSEKMLKLTPLEKNTLLKNFQLAVTWVKLNQMGQVRWEFDRKFPQESDNVLLTQFTSS